MAGFLSSILGLRSSPEQEVVKNEKEEIVYDTAPKLQAPSDIAVDRTPEATAEEKAAVDAINQKRAELLRDLPAEPDDDRAKFDADKWLDAQRILLYVRASKGNQEQAFKRLRNTLEWRCTYRPHAITPEDMKLEGATGKQYINGFDKGGRPVLYMFPHRQNTKDPKEHIRFVVFNMEQAIRSMPDGATKITIVIDESKYSSSQSVPLSVAREFLHILESHYPERLNKAFVLSPPAMFVMFYHLVSPFIDPVTKAKVAFVDVNGSKGKNTKPGEKSEGPWVNIFDYIDPAQLQSEAGGEWHFKYDYDAYSSALTESYSAFVASEQT